MEQLSLKSISLNKAKSSMIMISGVWKKREQQRLQCRRDVQSSMFYLLLSSFFLCRKLHIFMQFFPTSYVLSLALDANYIFDAIMI